MYEFFMTILDQNMETRQNYAIQILIVLLILKPKIFLKIFPMMLKNGLIHLTMIKMIKDRFQQVRIKKYLVFLKMNQEERLLEVVAVRPKTYAYLTDDGSNYKKAKGAKKCVIKQKIMFENYKDCLFNNKTVYRSQERFKSYYHAVYTEEVNKIALSSNDNKRLQTSDKITTYPYGTSEMMMVNK